jgi:hypothetical protein
MFYKRQGERPLGTNRGGTSGDRRSRLYISTARYTRGKISPMDKTDTKIVELKNGGMSLRQIAKQIGISHVAVKKRLDRLTVNKTGNQAPVPETGQLWDMDEYPELNHAVTEIDGLLMNIEYFFSNLLEASDSITISTPNGWKIEKNRVEG